MMSDDEASGIVATTITCDDKVPEWMVDFVGEWRDILHLSAWAIQLGLHPTPNDEEGTLAFVTLYPNILTAHITIRDSIPRTLEGLSDHQLRYWQAALIHELIHIFIGRVTDFVEKDIWPELAPSAQRIAQATFTREVEPVVELLSNVLWGLKHG